jgi:hypothetical protein
MSDFGHCDLDMLEGCHCIFLARPDGARCGLERCHAGAGLAVCPLVDYSRQRAQWPMRWCGQGGCRSVRINRKAMSQSCAVAAAGAQNGLIGVEDETRSLFGIEAWREWVDVRGEE